MPDDPSRSPQRPPPLEPNPYAPPTSGEARESAVVRAPGEWVKWLYAGAAGASATTFALAVFLRDHGGAPKLQALSTIVQWLPTVRSVFALTWVYFAWKGVPPPYRGSLSPRRAVLTFFVPVYNLYWMFAINPALCATLDAILQRARERRRAPTLLAHLALGVSICIGALAFALRPAASRVATGFLAVAPPLSSALWLVYMIECDKARRDVARVAGDLGPGREPVLPAIQRSKGPRGLGVVGAVVGIALLLAIWNFLSPVR